MDDKFKAMIEKTSFVAMFYETMELWTNSQLSCILLSVGKKGKHLERILGNMSMSVNIEEVHCWWKKIENLLMNSTLSKNSCWSKKGQKRFFVETSLLYIVMLFTYFAISQPASNIHWCQFFYSALKWMQTFFYQSRMFK